jgi:hypothetical protein
MALPAEAGWLQLDEGIMEPPGDAVVNSEIVVLNATGKPSFNPLRDITWRLP